MKEYKSHKEVPKKYKWDLSFLLEGKTPEANLNEVIKLYKKIITTKDSKYNSSKEYMAYLKLSEKLQIKQNKIGNYISNLYNLDITDSKSASLMQKYDFELYKLSNEIGSENTRFFKNSAKLAKWAKLPEFKEYKFHIEKNLEDKKYVLPKAIEEYNIKVSRGEPDFNEVFSLITDSEVDYGYATNLKGKKTKITRANYHSLMKNDDKSIRKTAETNYTKAYFKHKDSLASTLYQHKKHESANLMARGFKSSVQGLIHNDRVDIQFLETLYKSIEKGVGVFKPYKSAHKKFYKNKFGEALTKYDWQRPLVKINQKVTVEDSIKDLKLSMKPFGKEYMDQVNLAIKENWVDFMTIKNKRSGAYSIGGTFGIDKKLILMNFTGDLRSTETLAHEIGHSMHSYYSDKYQKTSNNASYPIFLAEIASIFNELMLNDYLLKTIKDKKTKWYILDNQIKGFLATVIRQTQWSNYEYDVYKSIDEGKPIGSYEQLSKIYYENQVKYSITKPKKYDPKDQVGSIFVPHFYYGFYVYKYAIGQLVANVFFAKYKKEGKKALEFYIKEFLSSGNHKNPLDILKSAGVDLKDPKTYDIGFNGMKELIKQYIKLGNEIFKPKNK